MVLDESGWFFFIIYEGGSAWQGWMLRERPCGGQWRRPVAATGPLRGGGAPVFGLAVQTAGRRRASRLACVIGERNRATPVGAHLRVCP